jgi:hypothetical protein
MITSPNGRVQKSVRTFGTTTAEILALRDWMDLQHVSHLALESTGIFTPPPMLPIGGGPVRRGRRRHRAHTENDADLLLIDLNPFDQSTGTVNLFAGMKYIDELGRE